MVEAQIRDTTPNDYFEDSKDLEIKSKIKRWRHV